MTETIRSNEGGESNVVKNELQQKLGETALSIGVFCSARDLSASLTDPARELAHLIGDQGHNLVWGGSDIGTMHVISHQARESGGRIIGVTTESLRRSQHESADEMIITDDLSGRKMELVRLSDALVVLPGGTGTLDEVADVIERKKFGEHYKPIIFLNSDGFYSGIKEQFGRMEDEGMLNRALGDIVDFVDTPKEAMDLIIEKQAKHLQDIFTAHDFVESSVITAGHSGALLYRVRTSQNEKMVVKASNDKRSTKEVKSNTKAYAAMRATGPESLIPSITAGEDPTGRKYLIMPDLGETFTSEARSEAGADFDGLVHGLEKAFAESLKSDSKDTHTSSIQALKESLRQFQSSLVTGNVASKSVLDLVDQIEPDALSSDHSSFFLLDFTPDNIFVNNEELSFIDPWEQSTYSGSSIISISQFETLSREVYKLPGSKDADTLFDNLYTKLGEQLKLTPSQVTKHRRLGAALQYSLSAFTRMQSDPELSHHYSQLSEQAITDVIEKYS